jgi:hypothetical protein
MGDQMTEEYSCVRGTKRWPFGLFLQMVDIANVNAFLHLGGGILSISGTFEMEENYFPLN